MKKKITAALLLIFGTIGLLSCGMVKEDAVQTSTYEQEVRRQEVDLEPNIVINPVLRFTDQLGEQLAAETRRITVESDESPQLRIVEELLSAPQSEDLTGIGYGFSCEKIEVLPNLTNVYLTTVKNFTEEEIVLAESAIAETLADYSGGGYADVYVNGRQIGMSGVPVGVISGISGSVTDEINKYRANADSEAFTANAALYFLDSTEQYLLPEIRTIVFRENTPDKVLETLIGELLTGPNNTYRMIPVVDRSHQQILNAVIEQKEDGSRVAHIDFAKPPITMTERFADGEMLAEAAIAKTVLGFIPDIDGVEIYVNGQPSNPDEEYYTTDAADELLGNYIQLYFPNSSYTKLKGVTRLVDQDKHRFPFTLMEELMKGPSAADSSEISPAFLSGITIGDLNDVYLAGDIAVIDFNASMSEKIANISREEEMMMIYSIVNTMTDLEGIRRVQFLLDGERTDSLGGGVINVGDPLLRNPGIIDENE